MENPSAPHALASGESLSPVDGRATILVQGAREHNLKNVSLEVPRDRLIVFTGLSGSGKSSLAFDTIFREGQRRFMESLSPYARQFLGQLEKPRVDHIEGLSPTISIDQKTINRNPRSTVGTVTEIYDYLRLLFARLGVPHCPQCGREVARQSPEQIAHGLYLEAAAMASGEQVPRGMILAPIVSERKGEYRKELEELVQEGFSRARIDGEIRDLRQEIVLERYVRHSIEVVIDRVTFDPESRGRVLEAVEQALSRSGTLVTALIEDQHFTFATERACPTCAVSIPELEPRLFSFNSLGACPKCHGLGVRVAFAESLIVPDPSRSVVSGAVVCMTREGHLPFSSLTQADLEAAVVARGGDPTQPWESLLPHIRRALLHGCEGRREGFSMSSGPITDTVSAASGKKKRAPKMFFEYTVLQPAIPAFGGIIPTLELAYRYTRAPYLEVFRHTSPCEECQGRRLSRTSLAVTVRDQNIWDMSSWSIDDAHSFFVRFQPSPREDLIGREIFKELRARLHFLREVGLGYLNLNRSAATLSGGEAQRIRLAGQVGNGLQGVLYVLDEPSIGLHPRDNRRLLNTLVHLRDLGNTVLVVEHDRETMESADYLVEIGPGAGREGGEVIARGSLSEVLQTSSLTARYLSHQERVEIPPTRRPGNGTFLTIRGATQNNLQNIDAQFPLGTFVAVTGVSGSGKSTLITDILHRALARQLHGAQEEPGSHAGIDGVERLDKVIEIDQSPIGRTPRSNPATYTKVFDAIRSLFASLPEARLRGYSPGRFSFNVSGGRCEVCEGAGVKTIEMQFLADVEIPCDACGGKRFNHETLAIRYKGHTIHDVLLLTVREAVAFFEKQPKIRKILQVMEGVGLDYVPLGQPSTTLSGGEAQRVKLATELHRPATGRTLYILDEPTTGLHLADVKKLLLALQRLVDHGNTVIVIEHNLDVVKVADHVLDLGPEGGTGGGRLLATGTPEAVALSSSGYTAHFLRELFEHEAPELLEAARARSAASLLSPLSLRADQKTPSKEPDMAFAIPDLLHTPAPARSRARDLTVRGAHQNNLKYVDVAIPHNRFTVITGVSGSGKTSLAFDTLFAEGQRRYVESLSTYARRFLGRLDKAPVDSIDGIAPSISVDQKAAPRNPRSTVATSTEIHDYLRLLFARVGVPHCPTCGVKLVAYSPARAFGALLERFPGERGEILVPLVGEPSDEAPARDPEGDGGSAAPLRVLETAPLLQEGFLRARADDRLVRLDEPEAPHELSGQRIELVLDRVQVEEAQRSRISEALEQAFNRGDGIASFRAETGSRVGFSTVRGCLSCAFFLRDELSPQLFSFNHHTGACTRCDGLGTARALDPDRVIRSASSPLLQGALAPNLQRLLDKKGQRHQALLKAVASAEGFALDDSWEQLPLTARRILLYGGGDRFYALGQAEGKTRKRSSDSPRDAASPGRSAKGHDRGDGADPRRSAGVAPSTHSLQLRWRGLLPLVEGWYAADEVGGEKARAELRALMRDIPCPDCHGARLKRLPLAVRIAGDNIAEVSRRTVLEALTWFESLRFEGGMATVAEQILAEISGRLGFLRDVGLDYLTLERTSNTLSGGEAQRIRLASQLGSHLMGVLYVLDEPTIGLHPRDTDRLLQTLLGLRDRGNTVVVVEHDAQTMRSADYLLDLGPGAGDHGGEIVARGTPGELMADPTSVTGAFLSGRREIPVPLERRSGAPGVRVRGARANNLQGIDVHFPLGALVCVTGVSGSGKSSLVMDVLAKGLARHLGQGEEAPGAHAGLEVSSEVQRVGIIDQSPLGRSPKSNPASYVGVFELIRSLFAATPEARARGFAKGRFSFNLLEGRCFECEGRGAIKLEMHFLSDVWMPCEHCKGKRYNELTLEIKYRGRSIADVLSMEVSRALEFFQHHRKIHRMLLPLEQVGLGYMQVGQPANTMSGGEAQRVKLAGALMERSRRGFYILDEPTTGLHFQDVERLIAVLQRLVDKGNTVVVIEHNPDLMKVADWILDLGPEGGARGGHMVAEGTPETLAEQASSHTGRFLRDVLAGCARAGRPGEYGPDDPPDESAESGTDSDEDPGEALRDDIPDDDVELD